MDRFLKFIGLLTCIVLMVLGARWLMQHFPKYVGLTLQVLGGVALVVLMVRLYLGRDWLRRLGKEFVIGSDLIKATENLLNDLPKPKNETTANFIGHLVYRFTRLGLIGLMLAFIPITLLYQQNRLLSSQNDRFDIQNDLITKQNKRLDQQTYLQEAERRSSLVFLFSNIMDAIDRELSGDYGNDKVRNLSPQLIGRIAGLSTRLKPYYYLDGDDLITKPLSPERAQLLVSLINSELDTLTVKEICSRADFSDADLTFANLRDAHLYRVDLSGADLSGANLVFTNLRDSHLWGADLSSSYLTGADLSGANLINADLRCVLNDTNLSRADLRNANLKNSNLRNANLSHANMGGANLERTYFFNADLERTNLRSANLSGVNLSNANLMSADLTDADLSDSNSKNIYTGKIDVKSVNLKGVNLVGTNLKNTKIERHFFQEIQKYEKRDTIIGLYDILKKYQIDSIQEGNAIYFYLKSKN